MPDLTPEQRAEQIVQKFHTNREGFATYPLSTRAQIVCFIADVLRIVEAETWKEAMKLTDGIKEPHTKRANTWSVRVFWLAEEFRHRAGRTPR